MAMRFDMRGEPIYPDTLANPRVLTVPLKAVHRNGPQAFVWRRHRNGLNRVPVTLGIRNESDWEIVRGVVEGDEVVVGTPPSAEETS